MSRYWNRHWMWMWWDCNLYRMTMRRDCHRMRMCSHMNIPRVIVSRTSRLTRLSCRLCFHRSSWTRIRFWTTWRSICLSSWWRWQFHSLLPLSNSLRASINSDWRARESKSTSHHMRTVPPEPYGSFWWKHITQPCSHRSCAHHPYLAPHGEKKRVRRQRRRDEIWKDGIIRYYHRDPECYL